MLAHLDNLTLGELVLPFIAVLIILEISEALYRNRL